MSTDKPIIEVKNLSKVYNIGHEQKSAPGTLTFRDSLAQTLRKPLEVFTGHRIEQEKFWALKNVGFEVNQGDVVGIIGRNGSGKSTLLKVLSRIVEPTEGEITMRGRVASLLEVGTGFHPELTGRENVFFNGAILGMSQKEIKSKFDEIVAFSEVEKFLDTPVKFYSSGMYVRLAFAVAAHLDPDILIVDEVLAVGDAAFQKKCLGKMKDVAGQGRTVLFVSHSMAAVQALCTTCIFIQNGTVVDRGPVESTLKTYIKSLEKIEELSSNSDDGTRITSVASKPASLDSHKSKIEFQLSYLLGKLDADTYINLHIDNEFGLNVLHFRLPLGKQSNSSDKVRFASLAIASIKLKPGYYSAFFRIYRRNIESEVMVDSPTMPFSVNGDKDKQGIFIPEAVWSIDGKELKV